MKKITLSLIIVLSLFTIFTPVLKADDDNFGRKIKNTIQETVEEGQEASLSPKEIRAEVRENVREEVQERKEGLMDKVKNFVKKNLRFSARIMGTIASISTDLMTVTGDNGKTYTINITEDTKLMRKFGGEAELTEFAVGNEVNVFGKFTDESQLTIDARLIRNLSIQKRWGVFFGEVTSMGADSFVIKTIQRGDLTVDYDEETEFENHKKESINPEDLEVGMRVRVKGVWDMSLDKIVDTDEVRVFPKSNKPSDSPEPTEVEEIPTPTATSVPTSIPTPTDLPSV